MTRAEISGALQALNVTNTRNRAAALRLILAPKFAPKVVDRVIADLKTYPEWTARMDLEDAPAGPSGSASADPKPDVPAAPKAKKKARG